MDDTACTVRERLHEIDDHVMAGLTPFQRETVEHIASLYQGKQRRVLVADEVGLGKTLIARGVISKIALMREAEGDDLVKIAYICSNASIAAQNVAKLSIDGDVELAKADDSRLSMQHLTLAKERGDEDLRRRYIQITPLTPATSFSISAGPGTMAERALMLAVLAYDQRFAYGTERYEKLKDMMWCWQTNFRADKWGWCCQHARGQVASASAQDPTEDPEQRYPYDVLAKVASELVAAGKTSFDAIAAYLDEGELPASRGKKIVIALRQAFSSACVNMLSPDFVIMDEFQRFRDLLSSEDTETALLARRFLSGDTRVLLLSATPFRMYSTDAELDNGKLGDSYREFLEVMGFLSGEDAEKREEFAKTWGCYTLSLRSMGTGACDVVSIEAAKGAAEQLARQYVARTERQSTGELGAIVDNKTHVRRLEVTRSDVNAYLRMKKLVREAGIRGGLMSADFVKSCPFPLSFMSGYKLYAELVSEARKRPSLISANRRADGGLLWLRRWDVAAYDNLSVGNARYRALWKDIAGDDDESSDQKLVHAEQLLWVPASMPYYTVGRTSPFARAKGFSKMILFSSWAMVPPAVACILSYEFERKNVLKLQQVTGRSYRYFKDGAGGEDEREDAQALPYRRVRFSGEQRTGFLLVYPSRYLASLVSVPGLLADKLSLAELRRRVKAQISVDLARALGVPRLPSEGRAGQRASLDWYIMAALKLDEVAGKDVLGELLALQSDVAFATRYKAALGVLEGIRADYAAWDMRDFGRFPADLVDVLADAAIASPAVCALRTYAVYGDEVPVECPFEFGLAFVNRMNTSSATLTVAAVMEKSGEASVHWKNLLAYACDGNLQAVVDEYAYLQRPMDVGLEPEEAIRKIHRAMVGSGEVPDMHNVETRHSVNVPRQKNANNRVDQMPMRTNIASAFMEPRSRSSSAGSEAVSRSELRNAFNSPFRPFVLVSTSVGQEGLDFHKYCRKICHWNLPANPIDLEQREGRVNRYQGLSVRQSIVERYGDHIFEDRDVWRELFEVAEREELAREGDADESGLLPNWGIAEGDEVVPVERYAYLYPFSRDEDRYDSLMRQVYEYRAVLGQPDQEELLRMLEDRLDEGSLSKDDLAKLYVNLCPFVWRRGNTDGERDE